MRGRITTAKILFAIAACSVMCLIGFAASSVRAKADVLLPSYIQANYSGGYGLVGQPIDKSKLTVKAVYSNGVTVEVEDYTLSTDMVERTGINVVIVTYQGRSTTFYITGKQVVSIYAYYIGQAVSVGNAVDKSRLVVNAIYADGTTRSVQDYTLSGETITQVGKNTLHVEYGGKSASFIVTGCTPMELKELKVLYTGKEVMVGNKINRDEIVVTAWYTNGLSERIVNYDLVPEAPSVSGDNTIVVSYRSKAASFVVKGYQKEIQKLSAYYTGKGVGVGDSINKDDVKVTVFYTDGTAEDVKDFDIPTPGIFYQGAHVKTVHYKGYTAEFYVVGIQEQPTSYVNSLEFKISNGIRNATCKIALPSGIEKGVIWGESIKKAKVSQVVPRAIRKSDFIAFEIGAEPDGEDELPLEMRITVPAGYNAKDCVLYYTPNRKTIIAKMNTEVTKSNELVVTIHKIGTFLLAYEPEPEEE